MGRLSGKVAIITGAAGGQGEAEARLFVAEGARVAITDIQERGQQVAAELGDAAFFLHHDVSDSAAWTRVVSETLRRFGKLDALVNNAAMFNGPSDEDDHGRGRRRRRQLHRSPRRLWKRSLHRSAFCLA